MTIETCDDLDVALDRVCWQVQAGTLDGTDALALLDDYRERVAEEVA